LALKAGQEEIVALMQAYELVANELLEVFDTDRTYLLTGSST